MSTRRDGICKLCLCEATLQDSHLLPRAIYKLFQSRTSSNSNPILVTSENVLQTSFQVKAHLLCTSCEERLNRKGEKSVLPLLAQQDGRFPFLDLLRRYSPDCWIENTAAFATNKNANIDPGALSHFAIGIFWKASAYDWSKRNGNERIYLGPYAEKLRLFLLAEEFIALPDGAVLTIAVLPEPVKTMLAYSPIPGPKQDMIRSFRFYVPGFLFTLSIGRCLQPETCFLGNALHPILLSDLSGDIEAAPRDTYFLGKAAKRARGKRV